MGQSKELKLLNKLLERIPKLKLLDYDNDEYRLWRADVRTTLEALFGKNSREFTIFDFRICSFRPHESEDEKRERYVAGLDTDERDLKLIIQMQSKKRELNKALRFQRIQKSVKEESKDLLARIIAKYLKERDS
ncbi:MAG: hypothetical protein P8X92_01745 [Dehalococcoidia bacterium]